MKDQSIVNQPKRIVIQGCRGAFHEIAARHYYGQDPLDIVPAHTFDELVKTAEAGTFADCGIMAIENSIAGSLMFNYSLLQNSKLNISGEVYLRIKQNLLTLPGVKMEQLKEVYSHPIAIQQCLEYFKHFPHIHLVESEDTAMSARLIQEEQRTDIGAIASTLAADLYGLMLMAEGIETNKQNYTRFLILDHESPNTISALNKVSVCFATPHQVGSLHQVLAMLANQGANLTKIQSAPILGQPWHYFFFVDFVCLGKESPLSVIDSIRPLTENLQILGIYKKGEYYEN